MQTILENIYDHDESLPEVPFYFGFKLYYLKSNFGKLDLSNTPFQTDENAINIDKEGRGLVIKSGDITIYTSLDDVYNSNYHKNKERNSLVHEWKTALELLNSKIGENESPLFKRIQQRLTQTELNDMNIDDLVTSFATLHAVIACIDGHPGDLEALIPHLPGQAQDSANDLIYAVINWTLAILMFATAAAPLIAIPLLLGSVSPLLGIGIAAFSLVMCIPAVGKVMEGNSHFFKSSKSGLAGDFQDLVNETTKTL